MISSQSDLNAYPLYWIAYDLKDGNRSIPWRKVVLPKKQSDVKKRLRLTVSKSLQMLKPLFKAPLQVISFLNMVKPLSILLVYHLTTNLNQLKYKT